MKRLVVTFCAIVVLLALVPVQAQCKFGIKTGVDMSKASFSPKDIKGKYYLGYSVGPMIEFDIPITGLSIDGAAMYTCEGVYKRDDNSAQLKAIEVPVNLKYTIGLGDLAGVFIAVGPQFEYNVGTKNFEEYNFKLRNSNVSANVGLGVAALGHLQACLNYNIPLGKTGESLKEYADKFDFKTNTWQLSLAYLF